MEKSKNKKLVIIGPIINFLISKNKMHLTPSQTFSPELKKFSAGELLNNEEAIQFTKLLCHLQRYLCTTSEFYRMAAFRKYVGDGNTNFGLLNYLLEGEFEANVISYSPGNMKDFISALTQEFPNGFAGIDVIAPLNLDENEELYDYFLKKCSHPILPYTFNIFASKWAKNITFAPNAPKCFYFPEEISALDYLDDIMDILKKDGIQFLFLKDEYDFNSGAAVPYSIAASSVSSLKEYLSKFYQNAKGVANLGGLVMEEFLTGQNQINLYKSHVFGSIIPGEHIHYMVGIGDYRNGGLYEPLIGSVSEQSMDTSEHPFEKIQPISDSISKYYPYIFSSIDYIFDGDRPKVIDLNSIAGSLGYIQHLNKSNDHNPFEYFLSNYPRPEKVGAKELLEYKERMADLNQIIHDLGACYISGNEVIQLDTKVKKTVKDILNS